MSLVAAAVCPHPPLIVPEVAAGASGELDELRAACDAAVDRLLATGCEQLLLVGSGPDTTRFGPTDHGSLRPYGVDWSVSLSGASPVGVARLPLSLTIGAWLLDRRGTDLPRRAQAVAADTPPQACARLGADLVDPDGPPTALLVLGDGSACRGEKSPGYADPRAEPYDERVATALAGADADTLLDLEPTLSAQLRVAGRAAWQVLAGAVRATGGRWRGELTHHSAPYGVAYLVAGWERR